MTMQTTPLDGIGKPLVLCTPALYDGLCIETGFDPAAIHQPPPNTSFAQMKPQQRRAAGRITAEVLRRHANPDVIEGEVVEHAIDAAPQRLEINA